MADTDTSQSELKSPPHTNGVIASDSIDEEDRQKMRPADIDADVKEMERRKRVDMIMSSKLFREELERIIETQLKDGTGTASGLMQQISDMMGVPRNAGNTFKSSNCVVPINDIRGIESMGYAKGEKILRCKLAAVYRLVDLYGWSQGTSTLITARLNQDEEHFLVNPYGMLFHEITASSLIKVDMQGQVVEQGTTNFSVNIASFSLHAAIHSSRPDVKCIIHVRTPSVVAISALKCGILPISEQGVVIGETSTHLHLGGILSTEEIEKIARNLGPNNKVLILTNQGIICCGGTIEEAFFNARNTVLACEQQLKLMPVGIDNLVLITDEQRKKLYDAAHKAPESSPRPDQPSVLEGKVERKWRVGGVEFEALMRMLDNAGFRTGYIYRHPLVKGEPPKPKNDVEVPPAVSSLGYLLEEEELYRQGLWKKLEGGKKGNDRSRWLNSPNVYQKVEILETGTPDPKKITKWVADGSPTHSSTPVKIENALQFVPKNTNPKEFKLLQQQIKDYRRADKISAGPQSHILEGVTWEEAKKMQDASVTQTGDQVVLMGAASKGIIQRGFQHNATMYKSPYAKNPFDCVTDEELDEYKRVVERKARGEFDDTTDYSESEGLSSAQINKRISDIRSPTSVASETEEESRDEPQVLRIEMTQAPKPSQPEVVMSDDDPVSDHQQYDAIEKLKSEALLQQSPVSRASIHSTKRKLKMWKNSKKDSYRTTDYFGHPKGSYLLPNPRHFHVATRGIINEVCKPKFVQIPSNRFGEFGNGNQNSYRTEIGEKSMVTINIGGRRTLSLDISMKTLKDFIAPFASALNLNEIHASQDVSSQTSYRNIQPSSVNIVELSSPDEQEDSDSSDFEVSIIKKMHEDISSINVTTNDSKDFDTNTKIKDISAHIDTNTKFEGNSIKIQDTSIKTEDTNKETNIKNDCFEDLNKEFDELMEEIREYIAMEKTISENYAFSYEPTDERKSFEEQLSVFQRRYPGVEDLEKSCIDDEEHIRMEQKTIKDVTYPSAVMKDSKNSFHKLASLSSTNFNCLDLDEERDSSSSSLEPAYEVELCGDWKQKQNYAIMGMGNPKEVACLFLDLILWRALKLYCEEKGFAVDANQSKCHMTCQSGTSFMCQSKTSLGMQTESKTSSTEKSIKRRQVKSRSEKSPSLKQLQIQIEKNQDKKLNEPGKSATPSENGQSVIDPEKRPSVGELINRLEKIGFVRQSEDKAQVQSKTTRAESFNLQKQTDILLGVLPEEKECPVESQRVYQPNQLKSSSIKQRSESRTFDLLKEQLQNELKQRLEKSSRQQSENVSKAESENQLDNQSEYGPEHDRRFQPEEEHKTANLAGASEHQMKYQPKINKASRLEIESKSQSGNHVNRTQSETKERMLGIRFYDVTNQHLKRKRPEILNIHQAESQHTENQLESRLEISDRTVMRAKRKAIFQEKNNQKNQKEIIVNDDEIELLDLNNKSSESFLDETQGDFETRRQNQVKVAKVDVATETLKIEDILTEKRSISVSPIKMLAVNVGSSTTSPPRLYDISHRRKSLKKSSYAKDLPAQTQSSTKTKMIEEENVNLKREMPLVQESEHPLIQEKTVIPKPPKFRHVFKEPAKDHKQFKQSKKRALIAAEKKSEKVTKDKHKKLPRQSKKQMNTRLDDANKIKRDVTKKQLNCKDYFEKLYELFQSILDMVPISRMTDIKELLESMKILTDVLADNPDGELKNLNGEVIGEQQLNELRTMMENATKHLPGIQKTVRACKHKIRLRKGQSCVKGICKYMPKIEHYLIKKDLVRILGRKMHMSDDSTKTVEKNKKQMEKILFAPSQDTNNRRNYNNNKDTRLDPGAKEDDSQNGTYCTCEERVIPFEELLENNSSKDHLDKIWKAFLHSKLFTAEVPLFCESCRYSLPIPESIPVALSDLKISYPLGCKICKKMCEKGNIFLIDIESSMSCSHENHSLLNQLREKKIFEVATISFNELDERVKTLHGEKNVNDNNADDNQDGNTTNESLYQSIEEGFLTENSRTSLQNISSNIEEIEFYENVGKMATIICECIAKQCHDMDDLVLFPEINYDVNVAKMLNQLKDFYIENFRDISDQGKSELTVKVVSCIWKKMDKSFTYSIPLLSKKLRNIVNFVAQTFEALFDMIARNVPEGSAGLEKVENYGKYGHENHQNMEQHYRNEESLCENKKRHSGNEESFCESHYLMQSEESCSKSDFQGVNEISQNEEQAEKFQIFDNTNVENLVTFKARKSQSGNELYWITLTKDIQNESVEKPPCKNIMNVDDIPLKAPSDLLASNFEEREETFNISRRSLSPIEEEIDLATHIETHSYTDYMAGENTVNGDQSDAHMSTLSQSSKEDRSISEGSPKKDKKKKKKGFRTPSFLKKNKEKKIREA